MYVVKTINNLTVKNIGSNLEKLYLWKKNLFIYFKTMGVTKHWKPLSRDAVESPSLKIFKSHLDVSPSRNTAQGDPA